MIDTHSHLFLEEFASDLPEVIARARTAGVDRIYMPNIDHTTVDDLLRTCDRYPGYCFPMLGFHPTSVDADSLPKVRELRRLLTDGHPFTAIGEVGMDLYWDRTYLRQQQHVLDEQVGWALEHRLPLVLHCREAFPQLFEVLRPYRDTELSGIFHSFTGTADELAEVAEEYPRFLIGVNGVVTFKKSHLPRLLPSVPLARLVLETDSPYLAPVPFRGTRNESSYIIKVAEKLAEIYGLTVEAVQRQTDENALTLFEG